MTNADHSNSSKNNHIESHIKSSLIDQSHWLSFATFSWMNSFIYGSYKNGVQQSHIPQLSGKEECRKNTDILEELWSIEKSSTSNPSLGRVLWIFSRKRLFFTSLMYLISIILGFIGPTILMKQVMGFASSSNSKKMDGLTFIVLLIICELLRVLFFTLTWALSYRTALRIKTACTGLVYRKIFRVGSLSDALASKVLNVISLDCHRLYEVIVQGQVAIGGPVVLILSVLYILYELGWLSLIGISIFPLAYPLQYWLAKGSGFYRRKAATVKDDRVSFVTQAIQNQRFIKMIGWGKHFYRKINEIRQKEISLLMKSQFLQSWSVVLGPTLPHIGSIITFLIYMHSGNSLLPSQAFCVLALFVGRIRPTITRIRSGFRSYFDAIIAIERILCFTIIFVFSLLGYSVRAMNQLADLIYTSRITNERMESILSLPELNENADYSQINDLENAIVLTDLKIIRRDPPSLEKLSKRKKKSQRNSESEKNGLLEKSRNNSIGFQMTGINVTIKKGSLIGLCGFVGSGKSTFLEAIAGSLTPDFGTIDVSGKLAYVGQEIWTFKGTLRENIIFGEQFDSVRYYKTIDSCCLVNDFGMMPFGDLTITDEEGSNLSGGQKQRLSLARAIYSHSRDIYLFDDPFSGLNARVSNTVFQRAIKDNLRKQINKTILLATHEMSYLMECDYVLVFEDGKIKERGTHKSLMSTKDSHYYKVYQLYQQNLKSEIEQDEPILEDSILLDCNPEEIPSQANKSKIDLSLQNEIKSEVYLLYIASAGGLLALFVVLLSFILSIGSTAFSSWWLKHWFNPVADPLRIVFNDLPAVGVEFNDTTLKWNLTDFSTSTPTLQLQYNTSTILDAPVQYSEMIQSGSVDFEFNRDVYAALIGVIFFTSIFRTLLFVHTTIKACQNLHKRMVFCLFQCTLKGAERLGIGQILNLFSKDVGEVDTSLPNTLETFLQNIFIVLSIFILISMIFPVILLPLLFLGGIFIWIRNIYNSVVRDLKRYESNSKALIFSRVTETVSGLTTIQAFGKKEMFIHSFEDMIDSYHSIFYSSISSVRWLSFRLDVMAVSITGLTAFLILVFHGKITAAAAGLALAYSAQISGVFQFTVRLASETEAKFVAVERINTFLNTTQSENIELEDSLKNQNCENNSMIPRNWPRSGNLKFDSVVLSYSNSNDCLPALNNVSFELFEGQKLGICGRTGSGKSSIGNALFRLTELKYGQIFIDEVDIGSLSLDILRDTLSVVPQNPSIFQQTVRFNLDPGNNYRDEMLWDVLQKVGLREVIDSLDIEVGLSQGQKQLLSLARSILKKSKIVFIDEGTSGLDAETAQLIDLCISKEFHSSTLMIVAHRLSALKYCDFILVLDNGQVTDFGPSTIVSSKKEFITNFEQNKSISF